MKKLFLLLVLFVSISSVSAQSKLGYGAEVQTDFFAAGGKKDLLSTGFGFNALLMPIDRLSLKLGCELLTVKQAETMTYRNLSLVQLGASYVFLKTDKNSYEVNVMAGNDVKKFKDFSNYSLSTSFRVYWDNSFFVGLGYRNMHLKDVGLLNSPVRNNQLQISFGYRFSK